MFETTNQIMFAGVQWSFGWRKKQVGHVWGLRRQWGWGVKSIEKSMALSETLGENTNIPQVFKTF